MRRSDRTRGILVWTLAAGLLAVTTGALPVAADQELMQLTAPASSYTLGRFSYEPPKVDGWRQISNVTDSLSLVYAEQKEADSIDTRFGVAMEAHEIPVGVQVENAAALAALSRTQMAEARKTDLVASSPIEAVPSIDNLYTYRLLVHPPVAGNPDAYEVYYVAMAPDKSQYLVVQCITKTPDYANELYFNQFYGSLSSLKYTPPAEKKAEAGDAKPAAGAGSDAGGSKASGGDKASSGGAAAPAGH